MFVVGATAFSTKNKPNTSTINAVNAKVNKTLSFNKKSPPKHCVTSTKGVFIIEVNTYDKTYVCHNKSKNNKFQNFYKSSIIISESN